MTATEFTTIAKSDFYRCSKRLDGDGNMSLYVVRSKDDSFVALHEAVDFRSLYEYCETEWPELLKAEKIAAMRLT